MRCPPLTCRWGIKLLAAYPSVPFIYRPRADRHTINNTYFVVSLAYRFSWLGVVYCIRVRQVALFFNTPVLAGGGRGLAFVMVLGLMVRQRSFLLSFTCGIYSSSTLYIPYEEKEVTSMCNIINISRIICISSTVHVVHPWFPSFLYGNIYCWGNRRWISCCIVEWQTWS